MIALVVQRQALETAEFVLGHASVSDGAKSRFTALLAERKDASAGAKRLVLMDVINYFGTPEAMSRIGVSAGRSAERWPMRCLHAVSGLVRRVTLNPQATSNRMHDAYEKMSELARARDLAGIKKLNESSMTGQLGGFQIKNPSGRLLLQMAFPAFQNIEKNYWEVEDQRTVLLKRLGQSGHAP